ncbi:MAG TPA: orotidine-5'-phosphate decarboxylase [Acidimicrobiales bacterium]
MGEAFGERLVDAVARSGPLCAGIDPSAGLLGAWGLPDDADGLRAFGAACVEAFAGAVPVVKPQVAFYERHGSAGLAALETLIADATAAGLLVVADAKRGDIDSTSEAYADAWLGPSSRLAADAVTATPYLGFGPLEPLFRTALANGRGVFVVVRSSNPEGRTVQAAVVQSAGAEGSAGGLTVEDSMLAAIARRNADAGGAGVGSIGAVVGATLQPSTFALADLGGPLLAPGVGAQGGTAQAVGQLFAGCRPGTILPNVSRSVLAAGPSVDALRAAAVVARDDVAAALARKWL